MEARGEWATLLNRKCVFIRWRDLDLGKFLELIERGAGALVILLSPDMEEIEDQILEVVRIIVCGEVDGTCIAFLLGHSQILQCTTRERGR